MLDANRNVSIGRVTFRVKILVISHPCVTPINQQPFVYVEQLSGWNMCLVVPSQWSHDYGSVRGGQRWRGFRGSITTVPVYLPGNIPLHWYRVWFRGLLAAERPDVVYVQHEPYALATFQVLLASKMWRRTVPVGVYAAQNIPKAHPLPFARMEAWVLHHVSFAFPVSSGAEEVLRAKGYAGAAHVLPLTIDPMVYRPVAPTPRLASLRDNASFVVGYVGRVAEEKGLLTLLRAAALLRDLRLVVVVVGDGPFASRLDENIGVLRLHDRVKRIPYVPHDQTAAYFSGFDVLVLPSETRSNWKEQFGRVIVEALACGTAVIGSSSGEIPRLVRDLGGGLVFPEGDHVALAEAIRTLVHHPDTRHRLAEVGRAKVLADYTHATVARRFVRVVASAVGPVAGDSFVP